MSLINEMKNEFIKVLSAFAGVPASGDTATSGSTADVEKTYSPSEISLSDKVVGAKVELIGKDGSLSVAPDGEYEVDGFEFTVKDGLISAVESPVDENMAKDAPVTPNPDIEALKAEIETLKSQLADVVKSISGLNEGAEKFASISDVTDLKSTVEKFNSTIMKLAKLPAEPSKTNTKIEVKENDAAKLEAFAKAFSRK